MVIDCSESLKQWDKEGKRCIWFKVNIGDACYVPVLAKVSVSFIIFSVNLVTLVLKQVMTINYKKLITMLILNWYTIKTNAISYLECKFTLSFQSVIHGHVYLQSYHLLINDNIQ